MQKIRILAMGRLTEAAFRDAAAEYARRIGRFFDLTVQEIYEFLRYLGAPESIITKAPSAGLFEGQTDEAEMGVKYADIDRLLLTGKTDPAAKKIIDRYHSGSAHKRRMPLKYREIVE